MEWSPPWEADSLSATVVNFVLSVYGTISLLSSQNPASGSYAEADEFIPQAHTLFL